MIAPEERRGAAPSTAGDVYGLGAVVIEVLTGARVSVDDPVDVLRERTELPAAIIEALAAATARDAAQRPARVTELLRLVRRALGADVVAPAPTAPRDDVPVRNPYKGLHAFDEDDAVDFFGRAAVVDRVVQAVADHSLVAVVGPSGSGKSSIVRAGVLPMLRSGGLPGSERWLFVDAYPGSHPFDELAVALLRVAVDPPDDLVGQLVADDRGLARVVKQLLPGDDSELLLVIDQFEELFSLTPDAGVRQAFLDSLAALAEDARGRVRTVITLRADFFDRPLEHHGFGELVQLGMVSVAAPSRDELAQAIAAPARNVGVQFEPGLIGQIVGDVVDQPGGLPLLQYALTELFARRDGRVLTAHAYGDAGGVRGAVGRRAEDLYCALPAPRQALARQMFLRLVAVDEHAGVTRRRAHRFELIGLADDRTAVDDVLQRFGAHRLLTYDHDPVTRSSTVEVAHEALLIEWGRLRRWIAERRDDLLVRRRLAAETDEWVRSDRDEGFLVSGGRLEAFAAFVAETDLVLDAEERAFVAASQDHQAAIGRQRRRQRTMAVVALSGAALLAVALAAFVFVQRGRDTVRVAVDQAASLAAASRSAQTTDADLAVLLAEQAVLATRSVGEDPTSDALGALHEAVVGHRLLTTIDVDTYVAQMVAADRIVALSTDDAGPGVWNTGTGELERELRAVASGGGAFDAALSPDGSFWAESYSEDAPTIVWDVASGEVVQRLPAERDGRDTLAFDPTGDRLAVVDYALGEPPEPNVVRVYDVRTGEQLQRMTLAGRAGRIAISPDGRWLVAPSAEAPLVEVFDMTTGRLRDEIAGPDSATSAGVVAFDPRGGAMAVTFAPGRLELHDVDTGTLMTRGDVDTEQSLGVCYSRDGEIIAVTSFGRVDIVDPDDGTLVTSVHDAAIAAPAGCGPDGTRIVTGTTANQARLWDVSSAGSSEVWSVAAPGPLTGQWAAGAIVTMHTDGRLRRYVPGSGLSAMSDVATPNDPYPLATDGLGSIATSAQEGTDTSADEPALAIRDDTTLEVTRRLPSTRLPQAFDAAGANLLGTAYDAVDILDAETGEVTRTLDGDWTGFTPPHGGFLADGRHAVVDDMFATHVFDIETGRSRGAVCAEAFVSRVAVSPVGDLFAIDGPRGVQVYRVADVLAAGPQPDVCERPNPTAPVSFVADTNVRWMAFSPDGRQLATVSDGGLVSLWEPRTGELRLSIHHDGEAGGGTFSDDGRHLVVTIDSPGDTLGDAVRVYTLDVDELLEIADAKVTRELTPEECAGYNIAGPCDVRA